MERRQANPGPLRLAWPNGRGSSIGRPATLVSCSQASDDSSRPRKRPRTKDNTSMWVDKYAPTNASQLCMAPKKVKELFSWMQNPASSRLLVCVGSPGIGKSTTIRILASELGWTLHEWSDSIAAQYHGGGGDMLTTVDRSSSLEGFQEFLQRAGAGFAPLQLSLGRTKEVSVGDGKSIIMIDEVPNLHNAEAEEEFREIMGRHIQHSNVPTVLIFSNVQEGKHQPRDLERLVDPQYLYSEAVTIMQCHPVTKARMKKTLEAICKKESVEVPVNFYEEVHLQSGGDLRHAIMSLQFRGSQKTTTTMTTTTTTTGKNNNYERDAKLSMFHALGKLLYAKRHKVNEAPARERTARAPLDFDPERVMEQSGMELGGALTFLGYHSPDFFTDVSELSEAFDHYSDAAMLLDQSNEIQRDTTFPGGYVASIAGRAVADANKHPAPSSFRSLSAPKIFEVMRNRQANEATMLQLCKRLSAGLDKMPLDANLGGSRTFVTDHLPFMRTIVPGDVDYALKNLYSVVRSKEDNETTAQLEHAARLKEQDSILEFDDIVDDDDSSVEEIVPVRPGAVSFETTLLSQRGIGARRTVPVRPAVSIETTRLSKGAGTGARRTKPARVSVSPPEIILIDE